MRQREDELEAFKTLINLSEYAAAQGFALDRKTSSRNSAVMKEPDGEKLVIARGHDQHWIYFAIGDERDSGSIIDFVQSRGGGSLGEVRKLLRPWLEGGQAEPSYRRPEPDLFASTLEPISKDLAKVRARLAACDDAPLHPYLERSRGLPASVLSSPLFEGRIFIDSRGNAIFPHYGREGITGFEIKNKDFTGFSPGGEKGLWCSRAREGDTALVIAETAIDALSYAALHPGEGIRYVSTGGELNPVQPGLLQSAFSKLPSGGRVILALDNDGGGDHLAEKIKALFRDSSHAECDLLIDRPPTRGQDWNDALRASVAKDQLLTISPR